MTIDETTPPQRWWVFAWQQADIPRQGQRLHHHHGQLRRDELGVREVLYAQAGPLLRRRPPAAQGRARRDRGHCSRWQGLDV